MRKGKDESREFEEDLNGLFKLPLSEFTVARNALSAWLKKSGNIDDAAYVKALSKPTVSAWAVNQLYWNHRSAFNSLIAAGDRLRKLHASQLAGKAADVRGPLAERRDALSELSRLADRLLRDTGHNPTPDMMRRIATTLEALSTHSSVGGPVAGQLSDDVDPPGFESLASLLPGAGIVAPSESTKVVPFRAPSASAVEDKRARQEEREAKINSAKAALEAAEDSLQEIRSRAQELATSLKKASAEANEAEQERRQAEERLERASLAAEEARRHLNEVRTEAEKIARVLEHAEQSVGQARKELKDQSAPGSRKL